MNAHVESTDRKPTDYFFFGLMFWGSIIATAGVVTVTCGVAVLGLLLMAIATGYLLLTEF
jgi:hypothetical protein